MHRPDASEWYVVEFVDVDGNTIDLLDLKLSQIAEVSDEDLAARNAQRRLAS